SALRETVIKCYEGAVEQMLKDENATDLSYRPVRRLIKLYDQEGRKPEARALVLKCVNVRGNEYDAGYAAYQRINNGQTVATLLEEMGYPVDAARTYAALLDDAESLDASARDWGEDRRAMIEAGLRRTVKRLKPETLPAAVRELLQPKADP